MLLSKPSRQVIFAVSPIVKARTIGQSERPIWHETSRRP
jgi:hypothetical protein